MAESDRISELAGRLLRVRWVVRAPIWLYRAGLGFLFGNRMLLLEHRGRRSGEVRHVVLEVVDRPSADSYVIVSGFGKGSQWCRNVLADPQVRITVGWRRKSPAVAELLPDDAAESVLGRYAERHPRAWQHLRHTLEAASDTTPLQLPMFAVRVASRCAD
ncbi:hypothetical protein BH09ACT8_BH09ACT8_03450 [soil metagenome]